MPLATPGGAAVDDDDDLLQRQLAAKQQRELDAYQRELERQHAAQQRRLEAELARASGGSGGPALEVTVMRVVGCDLLTSGRDFCVVTFAGNKPRARGEDRSGGGLYAVVGDACEPFMLEALRNATPAVSYLTSLPLPCRAAAGGSRAFTKVGSDGNAHEQQVVRVAGEGAGAQQQTFTVELQVNGRGAALGTVQVAELHKVRRGVDLGWWC